jgi:hypothetical protein
MRIRKSHPSSFDSYYNETFPNRKAFVRRVSPGNARIAVPIRLGSIFHLKIRRTTGQLAADKSCKIAETF